MSTVRQMVASRTRRFAVLGVVFAFLGIAVAPSAVASGTAQINGSGSSWAYNAVNAWIGEVAAQGLRVTFTSNGSAAGRQDFANKATDFAVSDIGFQGVDPLTKTSDTSNGRAFAYVPLVAGGTSFPYHLTVAGQLVRNLRLSGATLAGIFTGAITNWDASQISQDNNGRKFPSIPIVPVVHSEGSGTSYQFSAYLAKEFPSVWKDFAGADVPTEYWPSDKSGQIAQSGSDQMMNYIASTSGQGTIGYDEYSYAIAKNIPVAKVENSAGYYNLPTQYNVAVALTKAVINYDKKSPSYLLETLDNVYTDKDPRTYPLSSYSYGIIPTASDDSTMSTPKRQTLADFLHTSICQGQGAVGSIGYSALPVNLVEAGFKQVQLLHAADSGVSLKNLNVASCDNPTFVADHPTENHLAQIAPEPPACDKAGEGPCTTDNDSTGVAVAVAAKAAKSGHNVAGGSGGSGGSGGPGGSGSGAGGSGGTGGSQRAGTGQSIGGGAGGTGGTGTTGTTGPGGTDTVSVNSADNGIEPVNLAAGQGSAPVMGVLAALLFLAALILPPLLWRRWTTR